MSDRLKELGHPVNGVSVGSPASDTTRFKNIKAENYWNLSEWLRGGGKLVTAGGWMQLPGIRYKVSTGKVIQIEPKQDLKSRTGRSPDVAEALMLTCSAPPPDVLIEFI